MQALKRTEPILPLAPGVPARQSHDYERHGVTSLFAAMDVASGVTISTCYRRHRHQEFIRFLNQIEENLPTPALSRSLHADQWKLSVAAKNCTILAGGKRRWSGYGLARAGSGARPRW